MINPETINLINNFMIANPNVNVSTVASEISKNETEDKNVVKAVTEHDLKKINFKRH